MIAPKVGDIVGVYRSGFVAVVDVGVIESFTLVGRVGRVARVRSDLYRDLRTVPVDKLVAPSAYQLAHREWVRSKPAPARRARACAARARVAGGARRQQGNVKSSRQVNRARSGAAAGRAGDRG